MKIITGLIIIFIGFLIGKFNQEIIVSLEINGVVWKVRLFGKMACEEPEFDYEIEVLPIGIMPYEKFKEYTMAIACGKYKPKKTNLKFG